MTGERGIELAQHPDCLGCQPNEIVKAELGGEVFSTKSWRVSHCSGPFGEGAMVLEPKRHVSQLDEITTEEEQEMIPLFRRLYHAVREATGAERVYINHWSHGDDPHIHWVFQPITKELLVKFGNLKGPDLQEAIIKVNMLPKKEKAREYSEVIRQKLRGS